MMQSRLIHTSPSHHLDPERVFLDLHSLTTLESQTPTEALWLVWLQKPLTSVFTLLHLVYAIANLVAFLMLLRLLQSALHAYSTLASTFQRLPFLACLSKKRVVSSIKQTTMPFLQAQHNIQPHGSASHNKQGWSNDTKGHGITLISRPPLHLHKNNTVQIDHYLLSRQLLPSCFHFCLVVAAQLPSVSYNKPLPNVYSLLPTSAATRKQQNLGISPPKQLK